MKTLVLDLPQASAKSYKIFVGCGALKNVPKILRQLHHPASRYLIITDTIVKKIAGDALLQTLKKANLKADLVTFPTGEKNKNERTHSKLIHRMLAKKCDRDTMILALGGGVVGDLAGYVAATYMRGISYVQIPTTLLAMVDSSIGGKVGVDTPSGKNLIGTFWHPQAIIVDTDFLKNLPEQQLASGLMEAVKIFLTHDHEFFEFTQKNWSKIFDLKSNVKTKNFLQKQKKSSLLQKILTRAIQLKIDVITRDERENSERMVLNFGHTIGHAVEHLSKYKFSHGYSIALGMLVETKISQLLGILSEKDFQIIRSTFKQFSIQEKDLQKFSTQAVLSLTRIDKKSINAKARYIFLEKIGKVKNVNNMFAHEVDPKIVREALHFFSVR